MSFDTASIGRPLSPQQRATLADTRFASEPMVFVVVLDGTLDEIRLREAFASVVAGHETLRTAFRESPGYTGLRQHPLSESLAEWKTVDGDSAIAENAISSLLCAERAQPLDIGTGRTLRAVLLQLGAAPLALVWIASRLVADARSLALLHDGLLDAYADRIGEPVRLANASDEDVLDYGQYLEWRDDLMQADDAAAGRAYWSAQVTTEQSASTAIALPYRRQPRSVQPERALPMRLKRVPADAATGACVRALAGRLETTAEIVVQAAWWVLVGRVCDAARAAGHWQHDCRRDYEILSATVGPIEAAMPVALDVRPERSFSAIVESLAAMLEAHRDVQEIWAPSTSDVPVGRLAFRFGLAPMRRHVGAMSSRPTLHTLATASFELVLEVEAEEDDEIAAFAIHHLVDHYGDDAAATLLEQLSTLLSVLVDATDIPVGDVDFVGPAERSRLLAWQGAALDTGARPIPQIVRDFGVSSPGTPALVAQDISLTYGELDLHVGAIAAHLRALGATRDRPVGIALPRSGGLVVALLAAMRAGAPYLPLDPDWPAERRRGILEQVQPAVVIAEGAGHSDLAGMATISIGELLALPPDPAGADIAASLDGDAYLLFTSGSTGTPKGVVVGHRQLLNYALASTSALGLTSARRFALTSTVAADLGNTTLFGALVTGGCLVVATPDDLRDGEGFARFVRSREIDCLKIVPSHLDALLDAAEPVLPATVVLGGEAASERLVDRLARLAPATRVFNHYGPTEATVGVAIHPVDAVSAASGRHAAGLPLTLPLANCRLHVLDRDRRLAPTGAIGELHIGGAQVCEGYWGGAGAEAFIDDPFVPGERLYRTGDLARREPGGGLRIVGRVDDQVKIRGHRIELGDVEAALHRLPGIRQAVARVVRRSADNELVAYVVAGEAMVAEAAIKSAIRVLLPEAMVPARIVLMPRFPRLPNGKIDRQALPDPASLSEPRRYRAPVTALDGLLANTMASVLECEAIGLDDDFFELGGHSLQVIRFVTRVQDVLRVELRPGLLFEHPTIAGLSAALLVAEASPGQLEKVAALRARLAAMSPEERARLHEQASAANRVTS